MTVELDHVIVQVNDAGESAEFYTRVLGFRDDGKDGPFTVVRASERFILLLSPWGTKGGDHLAFAMSRKEFDEAFARIRREGVPYGDSYDKVGNMKGPGEERSARGTSRSVYLFDPNKHLLEILHYERG